jgi:hypothetical protein
MKMPKTKISKTDRIAKGNPTNYGVRPQAKGDAGTFDARSFRHPTVA